MFSPSRRAFLGASLAGFAGPSLFASDPLNPSKGGDDWPFQPTTLFLTWHRDPTTTMDVQWIGTLGETSDTRVFYRAVTPSFAEPAASVLGPGLTLGAPPWHVFATKTHPYPKTDFKVFRAELSGLKPDTEYVFRIGRSSPVYRFRTMPAKATNTVSFISGGDVGVNSHAVANNIQAARQDPAFAIVGGDLGYDNGRSVEVSLAFIRNYAKHMVAKDGRLIPMITCLGNHEVDGGFGKTREKAPFFYALFDGLYPETGYATLDFGNYLSLVLTDTGHTSPIAGDQTTWLEKQLKERRDHPHVFVVGHVPAYPSARSMTGRTGSPGTGWEQRKHWVPLFEKFRVPVILEHHDHTFKRTKPLIDGLTDSDGVLYLGDGSWGRIRAPQPPERLGHLAALSQDYHLSLHRVQGEERFHLALGEDGRVMDVCRTGQRSAKFVRVGS